MPVRPRVDRLRTIYRAARGLNFGWKMSDFPSTPMYNGVCSFIPQLHRVTLRFCRQSESSTGMRNFIRNQLSQFANENPSTVVYVQPVRFVFLFSYYFKRQNIRGRMGWRYE